MAVRDDGSTWTAWSVYAGIPACLAMAFVQLPLAVVLAFASVFAWRHGAHLSSIQAERDAAKEQRHAEEDARQRARQQWRADWKDLMLVYDEGDIDGEEFAERQTRLLDNLP